MLIKEKMIIKQDGEDNKTDNINKPKFGWKLI